MTLTEIIQNIIDLCAEKLKLTTVKINKAQLRNSKISLTFKNNKKITEPASAIFFLLYQTFYKSKEFDENLFWNSSSNGNGSIYSELTYGKEGEEKIRKLTEYLFNKDEIIEARLCILHSVIFEDFIEEPLGKKLFQKIKLKSKELNRRGFSSPTSLVEGFIPLIKSKNPYEIIEASKTILGYLKEGFFYFSGKRREKLIQSLDEVEKKLKKHNHPTIKAYSNFFSTKFNHLKRRNNDQEFLKTLIGKNFIFISKQIINHKITIIQASSFAFALLPSEGPSYRDTSLVPRLDSKFVSSENAYSFYRAIILLPIPYKQEKIERIHYFTAVKYAIRLALKQSEFKIALAISKKFIKYKKENIAIAHYAACAFAQAEEIEKAIELIQFAIDNNYSIDKLKLDKDLNKLKNNSRFKSLFN